MRYSPDFILSRVVSNTIPLLSQEGKQFLITGLAIQRVTLMSYTETTDMY